MKRGRRFVLQLAILPVLWTLASADDKLFTVVVGLEVVIVWPISLAVAGILSWLVGTAERAALEPGGTPVPETLEEASDNAITTAMIATGLAAAGGTSIARIAGFDIPGRPVLVLLGWALVLVGIPSISWLGTLRRVWIPMLGPTLDRFRRLDRDAARGVPSPRHEPPQE